jgi:predicted MFS family arabinose efflux permease
MVLTTAESMGGFVLASAIFSFASLNNSVPSSMVAAATEAGSRGMLLGIYRFVGDLGFTAGPITMGIVLNGAGFTAAAWLSAVIATLAIVLALAQAPGRPRAAPQPALTPAREDGGVGP